jgi:uncharacterized membrane protein YfcA
MVVTGYMLCGAAGMVVGGFLVGRVQRLEKIIGICLLASAVLLVLVGRCWLPGMVAWPWRRWRAWARAWPAVARHAHQARRAARRHGPRLWHGVFGAGSGLCTGGTGVRAMLDRG